MLDNVIKKILNEATNNTSRGSYVSPLLPGYREFEKNINAPFTEYVTDWDDAMLDHDSLDGKMSTDKKTIKKREKAAEKLQKKVKKTEDDSFVYAGDAGVMNGIPLQNIDAKPIKNYDPKKTTVSLDGVVKRISKQIKEATSDSAGNKGSFIPPLQPGIRYFKKNTSGPFEIPVSKYKSPDLEYDSYDGKMERTKNQRKKEEDAAKKIFNKIKNNPFSTFSDEDGNVINQYPGKTETIVPIKEWVLLDDILLNEDLAVWFGTKKKPKGSKQPKGPWVDICRKVDGKHPPCGRSDTDKGAYPKCRAAGVAGKMSDSEKRSACQQKRRAEKKDTQTGKGQKPIMTSHKKINEVMLRKFRITEREITKIVSKLLKEQPEPDKKLSLLCQNDIVKNSFKEFNLTYNNSQDMHGGPNNGGFKRIFLNPDKNIPRETYDTSTVVLDAVPIENVSLEFLNQTELDNPGDSILFFSYKSQAAYFCTPIGGTDPEWITYLNSI